MSSIKRGETVKVKHTNNDELEGMVGTVIITRPGKSGRRLSTVGVRFDVYVDGHSCDEAGRDGYCYWMSPGQLEAIVR